MQSYYGKRAPGQMKSVISRFTSGINSFNSANMIGESFLSEAWDARPYKDEAINIGYPGVQVVQSTGSGKVLACIADRDNLVYSRVNFFLITQITGTGATGYWDKFVYTYDSVHVTETTITSLQMTGQVAAACIFNTEAEAYYCFVSESHKKLFAYARNDAQIKLIDLPFYPKKMLTHASRLFIIDNFNKVWWCKAGDISSWYGYEEDDDLVVVDTAIADGTLTIAAQPTANRVLIVTCTTVDGADTLGTLTAVTKAADGTTDQTEVFTLKPGRLTGIKIVSSVTSLTISGAYLYWYGRPNQGWYWCCRHGHCHGRCRICHHSPGKPPEWDGCRF